ncbi:unnamed protein product [Musa acuminata subsp. burmannicoides]
MIGASSSAALAPGFRFHPTDEELVGYYLRRKICGRPLRVDAIAEVDLYKCEPWDLPGRSRIRSRDLEWYFFSALDRKYSNRSRTNRATGHGFWKMTGKDRPVRHRARVVGMKKTLVFHAGRAPHGSRTNWVMHEYRLEDEELAHSGVLQDAYVVCRIFQKSGSGPQNGAQYGALFVEEEWEEEEADGLVVVRDGSDLVREQEHFQFTDILQNQELGNQHEDAPTIVEAPDGQDGGDHTDDPTMLLEMLADPTSIESMVDCVNEPKLQINPTHVNGLGEQGSMENCGHSSCHNNGYVELNDILNASNVGCHCTFEDSTGVLLGTFCEQNTVEGVENSSLQGMTNTETFSDPENHYSNHPELLHLSPVLDHFYLQFSDPGQWAEDSTMFYDACSNDLPITPDDCVLPNELLHSPTADPSGFKFDDLMGFSDTTDYLYDDTTDFSEVECINSSILGPSNFAEEVNHVYNATTNNGGASSSDVPVAKNQFENFTAAPDVQKNEGRGKTITELLVTMLGSISAPPAFAVEFSEGPGKHLGQICATESTSSIHIMARMIHMRSLTVTGSSDNCSLQKIRNMGFFLPCNKADCVVGKPTGCGRKASVSMFFRNVLNLFLLSGFVLAVSYKVGTCICFR